MMMPANFSAVNAEVVYGGAVADYLPSAWTAESVKRFNSNIITLVSNSFTSRWLVKLLLTRVIMLLLKRLTLSAVHALGR